MMKPHLPNPESNSHFAAWKWMVGRCDGRPNHFQGKTVSFRGCTYFQGIIGCTPTNVPLWEIPIWGSVKIPCWPACLESLGHRSGWGPHRFTWFGYMVLISVLICKGIPLSWSRSDLVSAWHLGGLRCPWPPSSNASPQRWSSTAQKKNWQHTHLQIHRPHFFGRGAQRSFVFLFTFLVSIYIPEST